MVLKPFEENTVFKFERRYIAFFNLIYFNVLISIINWVINFFVLCNFSCHYYYRLFLKDDIARVYSRYRGDYDRITKSLQASESGRKFFLGLIDAQRNHALKNIYSAK